MKKDVHPGVFVGLALLALTAAILIGYRSMNSSPKMEYPKGFNPAKPPGMGNASAQTSVPRPGQPR